MSESHVFPNTRYSLREAFDVLGKHIFGKKWDGKEAESKELPPLKEVKSRARRFFQEIERARSLGLNVSGTDVASIELADFMDVGFSDQKLLSRLRSEYCEIDLWPYPNSDEYKVLRGRYERRLRVEQELRRGITQGHITAWLVDTAGHVHEISAAEWDAPHSEFWCNLSAGTGGYRYNLPHTTLTTPPNKPDFGHVWIDKSELDKAIGKLLSDPQKHGVKGGSRSGYNIALQTCINRICQDITKAGGRPTSGAVRDWFEDRGAVTKSEPGFPEPWESQVADCDDLYIDGDKLVWTDREGRERSFHRTSLPPYLKRAKQSL